LVVEALLKDANSRDEIGRSNAITIEGVLDADGAIV